MSIDKRPRAASSDYDSEEDASLARSGASLRRITVACLECRARKSKCDGKDPCFNCIKNPGRSCEYRHVTAEENQAARRKKRYPDTSSHRRKTMKRVRKTSAGHPSVKEDKNDSGSDNEHDEDVKAPRVVARKAARVSQRQRAPSASSSAESTSEVGAPKSVPASLPDRRASSSSGPDEHAAALPAVPLDRPTRSLSLVIPSSLPTPFVDAAAPSHSSVNIPSQLFYMPFQTVQPFVFHPPPSSPPAAYHLPLPMPVPTSMTQTQPVYAHMLPSPLAYPYPTPPHLSQPCSPLAAFPFPAAQQLGDFFAPSPYYCQAPLDTHLWQDTTVLPPLSYCYEEQATSTPPQLHTPRSNPCSPAVETSQRYFPEQVDSFYLGEDQQWLDQGVARCSTPFDVRFSGAGDDFWGQQC